MAKHVLEEGYCVGNFIVVGIVFHDLPLTLAGEGILLPMLYLLDNLRIHLRIVDGPVALNVGVYHAIDLHDQIAAGAGGIL